MHRPAKDTRMQVTCRPGDRQFVVRNASKAIGQARRAGVEPVIVGLCRCTRSAVGFPGREAKTYDAHGVNAFEKFVLLLHDEFVEAL